MGERIGIGYRVMKEPMEPLEDKGWEVASELWLSIHQFELEAIG